MDIIAGIDYSMSAPSITVLKDGTYHSFFLTTVRKLEGKHPFNINGTFMQKDWDCAEQRFDFVSGWAMKILEHFKVNIVCLEGYAMGAKGQVFHIAENTAMLKHKMWKAGIEFTTPAPSQIKKFARELMPSDKQRCAKGKLIVMDKPQMIKRYFEETGVSLYDVFGVDESKKNLHPLEDIADSYFMCRFAQLN